MIDWGLLGVVYYINVELLQKKQNRCSFKKREESIMKEKMELIGIGMESIICQSSITTILSYCDLEAMLLLYYRTSNQGSISVHIQVRSRNLNKNEEATFLTVGAFSLSSCFLGEANLERKFDNKERNYRPWKIFLPRIKVINNLIVAAENPQHTTLHLPGISLD